MTTELVGRLREQQTLRGLLSEHTLVALHGAAGVGKTTLVRSFVARELRAGRLAPGVFVSLRGSSKARDIVATTRAAIGLRDKILRRSSGQWFAALSEAPPRTIVLDDAPATVLELIRDWVGRAPPSGWRLIVVTRAALDGLAGLPVPVLELAPLDRADAMALVARLEAARGRTLYDDLLKRTGCNPLSLQLALVSAANAPVETAASFVELVETSSDAARELLALVRAARAPIDLRALRATLGPPDPITLEALRHSLLVQLDGDRIELAGHAEAAAALLEPPTAAVWSALLVIAARALATDPVDADSLFIACRARAALGDTRGALTLLDSHGGARAALGRQRRLAELLRELAAGDPAHTLEAHLLLTREQLRVGDVDAALHTLDAADCSSGSDGALARKRNLLRLEALIRIGEPERAMRELGRVREAPALSQDHAVFAGAIALALAGELDQARQMLRALAPMTRACPQLEACRAAGLTMVYLCEERYDRTIVWARRARLSYATVDAPFFEAFVVVAELMALLESDRVDRAAALVIPTGDDGRDYAAALEPLGHDVGALFRAGVLGRRGELSQALAILEPLFEALDRRADRVARGVVARYMARACIGLGRFDEAEGYLRQAAGLGAMPGLGALLPLVEREWASLAAWRGEHDEAALRTRSAAARAPGNPYVAVDQWVLDDSDAPPPPAAVATPALGAYTALRSADKSLARGVLDEGLAAASIAERWYAANGLHFEHARALLLSAEANLRGGDPAAARGAIVAAEALATTRGYSVLMIQAALLEAAAAERDGDVDAYLTALSRAVIRAGDDLCDASLQESCRRAGLSVPPAAGRSQPLAALIGRLGLARPARYLLSLRDRVYLLDDDEWPVEGDLLVDVEGSTVGRDGKWDHWPAMRLKLFDRLVDGGDEGVSAEALYLDVWGGREYHTLRHRNMVYVAIQRLRGALRPWIGCDAVERSDESRYRLIASLQPAVRRPLPRLSAEKEGRCPGAVARWHLCIQRATGADFVSPGNH